MTKKKASTLERIEGQVYFGIPLTVMDSVAFMGASHTARSLLLEVLRQHNGRNNGHLHITMSWLRKRGWSSSDTVTRAKDELLERRLIVQTRQGGRTKPSLFAVSWLHITNLTGLDILPGDYRPGAYAWMNKLPMPKTRKVARPADGAGSPGSRSTPIPCHGAQAASRDPPDGSISVLERRFATPANGHNVSIAIAGPLPGSPFAHEPAQGEVAM